MHTLSERGGIAPTTVGLPSRRTQMREGPLSNAKWLDLGGTPLTPEVEVLCANHTRIRGSLDARPEISGAFRCDSMAFPMPDNHFRIATCTDTFQFCPEPGKTLAELYRVLAHNGVLVVVESKALTQRQGSARSYRDLFYSAGFQSVRQQARLGETGFLMTQGVVSKD